MANGIQDFYCDEVLSGKTEVEIVLETDNSLAFYHSHPYYEVHIVVIPKKHIISLVDVSDEDVNLLNDLLSVIQKVSKQINEQYGGCTVSTNIGEYQSNKHLHWHVHYGKRVRDTDGTWC